MITDKEFETRGYRRYPPSVVDGECVQYMYQKGFYGKNCIKYFITAKRWHIDLHDAQHDVIDGYEFEIQLYQKETRNALDLTFLMGWQLEDVEAETERIYQSGLFDPYEKR